MGALKLLTIVGLCPSCYLTYRCQCDNQCQWHRWSFHGHCKLCERDITPVWLRYDFILQDEFPQKSTTYHNLPPEGTDYAVCSQNWRTNSCAFLCNMFELHHAQSSRRYFDRKYFNRRMRFLFAKLAFCVPPCCREYTHIAPNILRNRCLLAVSCGKLWIFVESRLKVKPGSLFWHSLTHNYHWPPRAHSRMH